MRSHEETGWLFQEPTLSRIPPSILEYTNINGEEDEDLAMPLRESQVLRSLPPVVFRFRFNLSEGVGLRI